MDTKLNSKKLEKAEFEIKTINQLEEILIENYGKKYYNSFSYHLETNKGFVYELKDNRVIFIPNNYNHDGIVFRTRNSFKKILESDKFPIENPHKYIFEDEEENLLNLPNKVNYYFDFLNKKLEFEFREINEISVERIFKKIIGRSIKQVVTDKEIVGLIVIVGEYLKTKFRGKWFLEKRYGVYNPIYEPNIVTNENKIIFLTSIVMGKLKWKVGDVNSMMKSPMLLNLEKGTDYDEFIKHRKCIKLE